jgi:aminoglycoside phosphotransferase (APT) family kinase protein
MSAVMDAGVRAVPRWLMASLSSADLARTRAAPRRCRYIEGHSNDIYELEFEDDRVLLIKRARHDWVGPYFAASARAAQLIRARSDLLVPQPLPITADACDSPLQAYWRIPLPTLDRVWQTLGHDQQQAALLSLGALTRRLHGIAAPGWGPLARSRGATLHIDLDRDLRLRLLPAVIAHWPAGIPLLERLIGDISARTALDAPRQPVLVHTDLHLGNVLCTLHDGRIECVGFLDLDGVGGGLAEADVACFDVLHGRHFERPIDDALRVQLRSGYGRPLDEELVAWFHCVHLANQGFSSALLGHHEHAGAIADELAIRIAALPEPRRDTGSSIAACREPSSTSTWMTL